MPVGTRIRLKITSADGAVFEKWLVTAVTDESCTIQGTTMAEDGSIIEGPEEGTDTWTKLRDHAAFPAAYTTRQDVTVQALGQDHPRIRYVVTSDDDGVETIRIFDFATDLAGPPVLMRVTVGGQEVMRMEQVQRSMAG